MWWKACLSAGSAAVVVVLVVLLARPAWEDTPRSVGDPPTLAPAEHTPPPGDTPRSAGSGSTPAPAKQGKRIALLVGINKYAHPSLGQLNFAERDAIELDKVLRALGYEVVKLVGPDATKAGIEKVVREQTGLPDKLDVFLFAFAGHGLQFDGVDEAYLCPCDARPFKSETASLVSISWINQQLEKSFAQTRVLFVDACRNDPDPTRGRGVNNLQSLRLSRGTVAFFSCSAGQRAYENEKHQHGVFFHWLLEGLRGKAANEKGLVTFNRLAEYVCDHVKEEKAEQTPQQDGSFSGNLVLAGAPMADVPGPKPPAKELTQANPESKFHAPLSGPEHREELHFECKNGRATFIDLPAFMNEIKISMRDIPGELRLQMRVERRTAAVGPYRLRYVIERERPIPAPPTPDSGSFRISVSEWELEPITQERGEMLRTALAPKSAFRQIADALDPKLTVVTLWVYPDSLEMARRLCDRLHERGLDVAVRSLPTDVPIKASQHGAPSRPN